MSLPIQRPTAQLNLTKLINLPQRLSLQKPLTQFKASPPHPSPPLLQLLSLLFKLAGHHSEPAKKTRGGKGTG